MTIARIAPREDLAARRSCPEMAPQQLEKIESAPVNGMGSVASKPQHLVHGRAATVRKVESNSRAGPSWSTKASFAAAPLIRGRSRCDSFWFLHQRRGAAAWDGKFSASQPVEMAQNRERISETSARRFKFRTAAPRRPDISTLSPRAVRRASSAQSIRSAADRRAGYRRRGAG